MEKEPITSQGLEKLKKELNELKNTKRPKIVDAIAEARAHGDLKENAEYHAAREEQARTESRIIEINDLIARANVVDITKNYIYFRSPIGQALIGKNKKDLVTVKTPSGEKNFEIAEIKYI